MNLNLKDGGEKKINEDYSYDKIKKFFEDIYGCPAILRNITFNDRQAAGTIEIYTDVPTKPIPYVPKKEKEKEK